MLSVRDALQLVDRVGFAETLVKLDPARGARLLAGKFAEGSAVQGYELELAGVDG